MSVRNKDDRIHSFVIASALDFSHDKLLKIAEKWYSWAEFSRHWSCLVIPQQFSIDEDHKVNGYSIHFSAVKCLIRYLNQSFESCQTGEFIARAQSLLSAIYLNRKSPLPKIWYQVR